MIGSDLITKPDPITSLLGRLELAAALLCAMERDEQVRVLCATMERENRGDERDAMQLRVRRREMRLSFFLFRVCPHKEIL